VLAVQQVARGGIRGAAVRANTVRPHAQLQELLLALLRLRASPLAGALGGLLALVLQQAQQRLAAISEVPGWDASLNLAQPARSSKLLARWYSDLRAAGT
jgi:hypothetical protein